MEVTDSMIENSNTLEHVFSQNIYQDYTRFEEESNNNNALNNNHNLSWNFEIRPDDANYVKIEPDVAYSTAMSQQFGFNQYSDITDLFHTAKQSAQPVFFP